MRVFSILAALIVAALLAMSILARPQLMAAFGKTPAPETAAASLPPAAKAIGA